MLEKSIDADSIVQAVEEGNQQQNPRDFLLNISVSISSYLNTSSVENELKEFVSYLKQELRAVSRVCTFRGDPSGSPKGDLRGPFFRKKGTIRGPIQF